MSSQKRRTLYAFLLIVAIATISGALYFAAIDNPLMTSAVSFSGLLPAGALVYAISKSEPRPTGNTSIKQQRQTSFAILWIGVAALIGAIASLVADLSDALTQILSTTGAGLILGASFILFTFREEPTSREVDGR